MASPTRGTPSGESGTTERLARMRSLCTAVFRMNEDDFRDHAIDTFRNELPWLLAEVARLTALVEDGRRDTERLDALERYAIDNAPDDGFADSFAELEMAEDVDVIGETWREFTVHGPRTSFGCRLGTGPTLRAAIDRAVAWDGASNRNDIKASEPLAADPQGDSQR